jgi:amidase
MDDANRWTSAVDLAALVDAGEVTAAELTAAAIERIEALDPHLGAVVIPLFERATERAAAQASERGTGVPILLKDAGEELAGTPHWVGTQGLRAAGHRSPATTALAARFEAHGFVIIGKSAVPELSAGSTTEPVGYPPTRNPWDPTRSAGGSSGGAAAAVAAGLVPVAHGADGTGSLRFPAGHCGVCTLKPSRGRIPAAPAAGQADALHVWTQFALARDARDLRWLFELLASDVSWPTEHRPLRVGLLDTDPILHLRVAAPCVSAVHEAGRRFEELGHAVEPSYPAAFDPMVDGLGRAASTVAHARKTQLDWMAQRLGRPVEAGDVTDEVLAAVDAPDLTSAELDAAAAAMLATMTPVLDWWADHDLLVTPVMLEPAWPLGEPAPPKTGMFAFPFSFTGQPALVVPVLGTDDGLPVGVQIVGRPGADELLLDLALQLQEQLDWLSTHPPGSWGTSIRS